MRFRSLTLDTVVWIALGLAALIVVGVVFWFFHGPSIIISNHPAEHAGPFSPLTGLACSDPDRRPIAVMISSDPEARPLSGLAQADMVFEMPVTPNGITRMMAVYQCGTDPKEIGSIRSARQDFIPLAQGLKVVFAHWGGEAGALEELDNHVINNINALIYDGTIFYRKKNIPAPHNGFTTLNLLRGQADKLGYAASTSLDAYLHENSQAVLNIGNTVDHVSVSWPQGMGVDYQYDSATNTYARSRGGTPEIDASTGDQVRVSVVAVLTTTSSFLRDQYITVGTIGRGAATIYQDGRSISGTWEKPTATDMLVFKDTNGKPIALAPGHIWVEFNPPLPAVN